MAIKFIEHTGGGQLGFWEITETTDQLLALLNPKNEELASFLQLRNELRKREWLAARLLLRHMSGSAKINYDPTGKPLLENSTGHISISHSYDRVVLYIHPEQLPGIDIELITRNVERAARKFLSTKELDDCTIDGQLSNKDLMLRWCAKEAVFKMVPYTDVDFASQIDCEAPPLDRNEGELTATFSTPGIILPIPLHFRCIGEMLMVWGHIKI
ncbi:MAG: 4'-phosphopantetheinyl transferase superfamily protein [Bacteroidetes bacterium]|nr:4'-phosphopantetheinyl transferase superfamily protein [Bacteroidota bacterium]